MNKFFSIIYSIFRIRDLRKRVVNTLVLVAIYRLGTFLLLPGIDRTKFVYDSKGIIAWLDRILGSSLQSFSVLSLGIYPYITASIIMQFATINIPYFQRLQKEGPSGRGKLSQITRILSLFITPLQAIPYLSRLVRNSSLVLISSYYFIPLSFLLLTAGTQFCIFIADRIADKGVGNGTSVLITSGILSSLPNAFAGEISQVSGLLIFFIELAILFFIILITINMIQGVRKIPLQRAKKVLLGQVNYQGKREHLPILFIISGVMPIIMANMISTVPYLIANLFKHRSSLAASIAQIMFDDSGWEYNLFLAVAVFVFAWFHVAVFVSPSDMASNLKRSNAFIPGIEAGRNTTIYIDNVVSRITLFGALFLSLVAVVPAIVHYCGITKPLSKFFGGTNLIILIGTMLEIVQKIESYLFMGRYNSIIQSQETVPVL